jgi:hypothetical protein
MLKLGLQSVDAHPTSAISSASGMYEASTALEDHCIFYNSLLWIGIRMPRKGKSQVP